MKLLDYESIRINDNFHTFRPTLIFVCACKPSKQCQELEGKTCKYDENTSYLFTSHISHVECIAWADETIGVSFNNKCHTRTRLFAFFFCTKDDIR